jgi:hypothetical protein
MAKPVRRYGKAAEEMWQREEMRRLIEKLPRQPSRALPEKAESGIPMLARI